MRALGFCFVILAVLCPSASRADSLLLLHEDVQVKLSERWEAKLEVESKYRDYMSQYYDLEVMPWAAYRFTDWFKLGAGWRTLFGRKVESHDWDTEQRPLMDFIFKKKIEAWTAEDRVRVEYRNLKHADAYFRYRNRLRFTAPWVWTKARITPWVAWETYYEDSPDWVGHRWNRHRYFAGIGVKPHKSVKFGCYYYWENLLKNGEWKANNEIGFDVSLLFDLSRTAKQ